MLQIFLEKMTHDFHEKSTAVLGTVGKQHRTQLSVLIGLILAGPPPTEPTHYLKGDYTA